MKRLGKTLMLLGTISSFFLLIYTSCKKEFSCEDCFLGGKPPIADAGGDTYLLLPVDSVVLDGSNSSDPDDGIAGYKWRKVLGSDTFSLRTPGSSKSVAAKLVKGNYQFELTVTDKSGLTGKDTVQITISSAIISNRPPVANAGQDTTISLPANIIRLDGSRSSDPDNNISSYSWSRISGPLSYSIANTGSVLTEVLNLTEGIYFFELRVTDLGGLFSLDTVQIRVQNLITFKCDISNRNLVNARLVPFGILSQTRVGVVVAATGNKVLFAGGYSDPGELPSSRVDILDINTGLWTIAELSEARTGIATAVLGTKIYFGGGVSRQGTNIVYSSRVDIYDVSTNSWTIAELSSKRHSVSAVAAGNKVVFAGGAGDAYSPNPDQTVVDIYNASTNSWSVDYLRDRSRPGGAQDVGIAATAIGDYIYFAGNASLYYIWEPGIGTVSSVINSFNTTTGNSTTSHLSLARGNMGSIAVGEYNFWAGGFYQESMDSYTDLVEIRNMNTGATSLTCLFQPNASMSAVQRQDDIVFFTAGYDLSFRQRNVVSVYNKFDICNILSGTWSIGVLPQSIYGTATVSHKDIIYVAGGYVNGVLSNKVSKLEF